jgi:hypothetical protein
MLPLIATYGAGGTKADVVGSISAYDMKFLYIVTSPLVTERIVTAVIQLGDSNTYWCSVQIRHEDLRIQEDIS